MGPQPQTLVSSSVSCAHYLCHFTDISTGIFFELACILLRHNIVYLLPHREQTCSCHIQLICRVFFCVIVYSVEVTSIIKWQLAEGKNMTVKAFLLPLRIMIWPVSQRGQWKWGLSRENMSVVYCCLQAQRKWAARNRSAQRGKHSRNSLRWQDLFEQIVPKHIRLHLQ